MCICAALPHVANRTHVHVLQHPRESHCPIGTVRFAELGLERCTVEVHVPWSGEPSLLAQKRPPRTALLFPSPHAQAVEDLPPEERPDHLIVLDGTWNQVKALLRANPWLDDVPHLRLAAPEPSRYRIRAEPQVDYLSTLEALVATLRRLEPDTTGFDELLQAFEQMIDTQIARSEVREVRRRTPAVPKPSAPPLELQQAVDRLVLVDVETVGPQKIARPFQICAWRLSTGERFEAFVACDPDLAARKRYRLELPDEVEALAADEATFRNSWAAFVRPEDVLCAWHQRSLDVLGTGGGGVHLKALWCNLAHRQAGHLCDVLAGEGLLPVGTPFRGLAGRHMGEARSLIGGLLSRGH